jgi:hypothetical protein
MEVSVPAPPRAMTGDLVLVGPATEGPSRVGVAAAFLHVSCEFFGSGRSNMDEANS